MSASTTLLPFQPASMSTAQLAAASYLSRYSGPPTTCTPTSSGAGAASARATAWIRWSGFSAHVELYIPHLGESGLTLR